MAYIGKTNWQNNEIVEATDMNRIEQGIINNETAINGKVSTVTGVSGNMVKFGAGNTIADSGIALSIVDGILRVTY